jgi:hypothetical protein
MSTIKDPIDADQENTLQDALGFVSFSMQTWDMAFHSATSCDLE